LNIGIVGAGLIGHKRAAGLGGHRLVACADISLERARSLAVQYPDCVASNNPGEVIKRDDVEVVVVATTHDALAATALQAIDAGKHVLVEKPGARRAQELQPVLAAAEHRRIIAKVGFNHRFHPALQRAHAIFNADGIGTLMYIRGRYGHGGRPGYEHEWRANPQVSGGGELLDQGTHLIDLARWFAGDFSETTGYLSSYFWQMPVEDNAFVVLRTAVGQTAWLHASWTEWKNLFSFEVFGTHGKLQVDGLGGSYGTERLTHYRMLPELGPPETTIWEFPAPDRSWKIEFAHFAACIESGEHPSGDLNDAYAALNIIDELYAQNRP
jgi:predicted dehydrogenase